MQSEAGRRKEEASAFSFVSEVETGVEKLDLIQRQAQLISVLARQNRRQQQIAARVQALAARLASQTTPQETLSKIIAEIRGAGFAGASVALIEQDDAGEITLTGFETTFVELTAATVYHSLQNPLFRCLAQGHIVHAHCSSVGEDDMPAVSHILQRAGVTDTVVIPICFQWELLGVILVSASSAEWGQNVHLLPLPDAAGTPDAISDSCEDLAERLHFQQIQAVVTALFPASSLRFLMCVADHAALALRNARLHQEAHSTHDQLMAQHQEALAQHQELMLANTQLQAAQTQLEAQYFALEEANARLAALATTDGMTGLGNHRAFQEELSRQIARAERASTPLALLMMDVDHFKQYNDSFGHPAGDEVLKGVGALLREGVREGDFPARYGGEEFAVILPETDARIAAQVAERIRARVETQTFAHRAVTISIGIAEYQNAETSAGLLHHADNALYNAKASGRNRFVVFQPLDRETTLTTTPEVSESESVAASPATLHAWMQDDTCMGNPFLADAGVQDTQAAESAEGRCAEDSEQASVEDFLADLDETLARELEEAESASAALETSEQNMMGQSLIDGGLEGLLQEPGAQVLAALLDTLDRRSVETPGHSERVTRYALRLAQSLDSYYVAQRAVRPLLPRLTPGDLTTLAFGALLHDIGKVGIPNAILSKQGRLTEEEWRQIRRHPLMGGELLESSPLLRRALPIVRSHHERWDGHGYPHGLEAETIPLGARIVAVCDTLDVLTTDRPNRPRCTLEAARQEIQRGAGTQFDPDIVAAFLEVPLEDWERTGARHIRLPIAA